MKRKDAHRREDKTKGKKDTHPYKAKKHEKETTQTATEKRNTNQQKRGPQRLAN